MTAVVEVNEQYTQKFQQFIQSIPKNAIKLTLIKSNLDEEIKKRINTIDNGEEVLTPYTQGVHELRQRLQSKYGDS
jgi:vacuolar-type H+-ATPase subunit F/Vma7